MGRPLIATDVPGCRDVVEEGVNGYLCAKRDSRSLADRMERLARLPLSERRSMGDAARAKVQRRFSEEFVVDAYLEVLARLDRERSAD
jgi:glycosyltransferase involved in cell wall biosynthesis